MSGTSADGVDAALVRLEGTADAAKLTLAGFESVAYTSAVRSLIQKVRTDASVELSDLAALARDVAEHYAQAVMRLLAATNTAAADVTAIAAHGQTLFHAPPLTVQQFDPAWLAWRVGIDVVSDFRRADCAAGGQGAPLVPFADYAMFRSDTEDRAILNIGGIANVTVIPAGCTIDGVTGFDVGPGNCISDWLMRGEIDVDGGLAASGHAAESVVEKFLGSDYVRQTPPKSTDGPQMIAEFQKAKGQTALNLADELATAAAIVAGCIERQTPSKATLIVAGGGVHNRAIMEDLRRTRVVRTTDDFGTPTQAREAMAFALLGAATIDRVPANLPRVTGASRPVVLGAITPKP